MINSLFRFTALIYCFICSSLCAWADTKSNSAHWHYASDTIMGTQTHIHLYNPDKELANRAIKAGFNELKRIDLAFSPYKKTSELYRINHREDNTQLISDELARIITKAQYYSELSNGAFDITFASVGAHYNFRAEKKPSQDQQQVLLNAINFRHLTVQPEPLRLVIANANTQLDLGGIAKGYAIDRVIEILKEHGIEHASVAAGGDARVIGQKGQRPWMIGIKHPRAETETENYVASLPLENLAISTSGDYERFFIDDQGLRVHHILNPKTGAPKNSLALTPSKDQLISVSVIGPNGFDTDPLSTSVFVLGLKKGLNLINSLPEYEAVVINADKKLFYSSGLGH